MNLLRLKRNAVTPQTRAVTCVTRVTPLLPVCMCALRACVCTGACVHTGTGTRNRRNTRNGAGCTRNPVTRRRVSPLFSSSKKGMR